MTQAFSGDREASPESFVSSALLDQGPAAVLPVPLTRLVGRAAEVAAARDALRFPEVRLVTLTGPGGVGKSRIAIQVATELQAEFAQGVYLIQLAALDDPDLLFPTIANAIGLPDPGMTRPVESLRTWFQEQQMLLLLDSFDPIISAAPLLANLLRSCPNLKALVTCRARLRIRGERVYRIAPLPTPTDDEAGQRLMLYRNPAVQLFVQQAAEIEPEFVLTDKNAAAIVEIVRRLDGLPLAIELAAARMELFSPEALLARLERRLPLLRGGPADLPDRQQTLQSAIAWSYDLLPADEQQLFRYLTVFAGGFPWDAVQVVCAETMGLDVLDGIASLLDKSLIYQEPGQGEDPRYSMLDTIREFGLDQLEESGEAIAVRQRHAAWCIDLAERAAAVRFEHGKWATWLTWLDQDHDDLRAACAWLEQSGEDDGFLRLTAALGWFWLYRSHRTEGRRWLQRAIAQARQAGTRTVALAQALDAAAVLALTQGAYEEAEVLGADYLALSEELGYGWGTAAARNLLGAAARATGDFDQAADEFTKALAHFQHDLPDWVALALVNLGTVSFWRGDNAHATALFTEALARYREQDNAYGIAMALQDLALTALSTDHLKAAKLFHESLAAWRQVGTKEGLVDWLARVASLAVAIQQSELGVRLFGTVDRIREAIGYNFEIPERARQQQVLETARNRLGTTAFSAALQVGQEWSLEEALTQGDAFLETLRDTGTPSRVPENAVSYGLTARELDVLRLLAQRLTDREIAEALSISPKTAGYHVGNILGKLGAADRRDAAALAVRFDLV